MSASLGSASGSVEKASFFRSPAASLGSSFSLAEGRTLFRSLSVSWAMNSLGGRDTFFSENLRLSLNTRGAVSGHYECQVNVFVNCGAITSSFAFLVIALIAVIALVFGIYATRQYWQSPTHREVKDEVPEYFIDRKEKVVEDEEGWETRSFDDKEDREKKDDD